MELYKERNTCRLCGGGLEIVLDLGLIAPSDFTDGTLEPHKVPLTLCKCTHCDLVQLKHTVNSSKMYSYYYYKSSLNASMVRALEDIMLNIRKRVWLDPNDIIVDVGANDGTLLKLFGNSPRLLKIAIDPAENLAEECKQHCDIHFTNYFDLNLLRLSLKAKVITSIACFYDLEDPHKFVTDIKSILHPEGLWCLQLTDLVRMMKSNAFDNIVHEHLEYYSFAVIKKLLAQHGLEVFDVQINDVNGGSIRVFAGHPGVFKVQDTVLTQLNSEESYLSQWPDPFKAFADRVEKIKTWTNNVLYECQMTGHTVHVMGASTKGNTTLQYFGLGNKEIQYAAEVNSDKFGKRTVATNIPIISEADSLKMQPDYYLLLPWHFKDGIIAKNAEYLSKGGQFIIPMPNPEFVPKEYPHALKNK